MGLLDKIFGSKAPEAMPVHVDDANFEQEVYRSELPVLLDLWGPNCAPCKQLESIIVRLARDYDGRIKVCEVNTAQSPRVAQRLGVRGTPTVIYFDGRTEVTRVVGFRGQLYHQEIIETDLLPRLAARTDKKKPNAAGGTSRDRD